MLPITRFVIDSIMPQHLTSQAKDLKPPPFLSQPQSWIRALEYSKLLQCKLPFLINLDRVSWKNELPEMIKIQFDEQLKRELVLGAILDHELDCILFSLLNAKCPILLIKGVDLAKRFYPEKTWRPLSKIYFYTYHADFFEMIRVLGEGGYALLTPPSKDLTSFEVMKREGGPVIKFQKKLLPHWSEEDHFKIWKKAKENSSPSLPQKLKVLHCEDLLLYLIHVFTIEHLLDSPLLLNDLHFLIESPEFKSTTDWDRIQWSFVKHHSMISYWFVLHFLSLHWGTPIPKEVLKNSEKGVGLIKKYGLSYLSNPYSWFPVQNKPLHWILGTKRKQSLDQWT